MDQAVHPPILCVELLPEVTHVPPVSRAARLAAVAAGMVGKRLRYDDLIATPEPVSDEPW